ncbi:MAG: adenosine kinase [Bacteroidales bacterium]|jgi:sugar/nucleoside kinase (ribokinase family)|nr:adenosine kinase [Bacteroidales bacterium]
MKKIIGIGNALVDVMTIIPDDTCLGRFSLPKGSMTMVDANRSNEIKQAINGLKKTLASGGSAGNTMYGLGVMGVHSSFIGKVGRDELGNFYEKDMVDAGLAPVIIRSQHSPTGTAVALVTPDSERTFATHLGAATELTAEELSNEYFRGYHILYLEGYLIYNLPLVEHACRMAKDNNMCVALDLASYNVVNEMLPAFERIVREYVDIVFANEEEARAFTGGLNPVDALKIISGKCEIAIVKTGADGSWIKRGDEVIKADALKVDAVDTTGAGDLYAAGFLYGYSNGFTLDKCGLFGSILAGKVIEVIGARMPSEKWTEARKLVNAVAED